MKYVIGVDVGGTCTDGVVRDEAGVITIGKAFSTPPNFNQGIMDSLAVVANALGLTTASLLEQTSLFLHACTVGENALMDKTGAKAGILLTRGFEETLFAMRGGYGRWSGLTEDELRHPVFTNKPTPIIPLNMARGIKERTDYKGAVLVAIDPDGVTEAVESLIGSGAQAIGVCFLWSFKNPANEISIKSLIEQQYPDLFVTISSEVSPTLGEYERASTVALSAYLGPVISSYLGSLQEALSQHGFRGAMLVMQAYGGLVPPNEAVAKPVGMIESGPVSGIKASEFVLNLLDETNVISTDLGGTTFKAGIIREGRFDYAREPMVNRYHYSMPKIDVVSIGAGGGSIISLEPRLNLPQIGPRSAGAHPGPVCYNFGGDEPTLTDVDLILGYLEPRLFLGGRWTLNREKAFQVFKTKMADPLGMDVLEAAAKIYKLANNIMFDLLHKITVERGLDPRGFALAAYGGQAGLHVGAFGPMLGVKKIIIPHAASVLGAFGLIASDVVHEYNLSQPLRIPARPDQVNQVFDQMREKAIAQLLGEGFDRSHIFIERFLDIRYGRQVHVVTTPLESRMVTAPVELGEGRVVTTPVGAPDRLSEQDLDDASARFEILYEQRYGKGSAYKEAGMEIINFRLRSTAAIPRPRLYEYPSAGPTSDHALLGSKEIYLEGQGLVNANLYGFEKLLPENRVNGPAIVLTPVTTVLVFEGQVAVCDRFKNLVITY
jgi:N-methylhydantoinase A